MPLDTLPERLITPTRSELRDLYTRSYKLRRPSDDVREGTAAYARGCAVADAIVPVLSNAQYIAGNADKSAMRGELLLREGESLGQSKLPAEGASGYATIDDASDAGGTIFADDECTAPNGKRYKCLVTSVYYEGDYVPLVGVDVGPATDQDPDTRLTWTTPRPGIGPTMTVAEKDDGTGLSGGRDEETDEEYSARLADLRADPPASGNAAEYQALVRRTPGVPIGAAFTIESILGPGTVAIVALLRPSVPGASRVLSSVQRASVMAWIAGQMPAGDVRLQTLVTEEAVDVALQVTWATKARGFVDAVPWPEYDASPAKIKVPPTATPTSFRISIGGVSAPTAGKTIAVFDRENLVFRRKKILTATLAGAGLYDIVCDTALGASDTTYTPQNLQMVCPWSDSLDSLVADVVAYFDGLGPGEQVSSFWDPGLRQRRTPVSPAAWPSVVTNRMLERLFRLPVLQDVELTEPSVPHTTTVGTPGTTCYLTTLGTLAVFPQ